VAPASPPVKRTTAGNGCATKLSSASFAVSLRGRGKQRRPYNNCLPAQRASLVSPLKSIYFRCFPILPANNLTAVRNAAKGTERLAIPAKMQNNAANQ